MGEARAAGAELLVLGGASLGALIALGAPGHAHRAAAGVHAVPPRDGGPAALVLVGQVAVLRAQVCKSAAQDRLTPPRRRIGKTLTGSGAHSPMHILPLTSTVIPGGHWQKKEPGVLMHLPLMQTPGKT